MKFDLTNPCNECPFLKKWGEHGYALSRLKEFASHAFHCHKTGTMDEEENGFVPNKDGSSQACAGMLIFNEKRGNYTQTIQLAERLGLLDRSKLNLKAPVR